MAPARLFQSALALSDLERFYREVRATSQGSASLFPTLTQRCSR